MLDSPNPGSSHLRSLHCSSNFTCFSSLDAIMPAMSASGFKSDFLTSDVAGRRIGDRLGQVAWSEKRNHHVLQGGKDFTPRRIEKSGRSVASFCPFFGVMMAASHRFLNIETSI